jgi:hypothetical protein
MDWSQEFRLKFKSKFACQWLIVRFMFRVWGFYMSEIFVIILKVKFEG